MDLDMRDKSLFDHDMRNNGYAIVKIENITPIDEIRSAIATWLMKKYNACGSDEELLNNIHLIGSFKNDADANSLTLECIQHLTEKYRFDSEIHKCATSYFLHLFGPDIHSQKGNNIVIQHPHSKRNAELHIDAPPTSKFEVVCWVPLVDCYATKSFYVVPLKDSALLLNEYRLNKYDTWEEFKKACLEKSNIIEAKYGEILFFSSTLLHGSGINNTNETRWCLNTRYKSLFAPAGMHEPLSFYNVLSTSPMTDIGLGYY